MVDSMSMEEMLVDSSPQGSEPMEGSGLDLLLTTLPGPDAMVGLELNQGNSSNSSGSGDMEDGTPMEECSWDRCRHHTYDTLTTQLKGCGEVRSGAGTGVQVTLVLWSIVYLLGAAHEATFLGRRIFVDNLVTRLILAG